MSKGGGIGSKRNGAKFNKGLGRCAEKHGEQCGLSELPKDKHLHDKKHKHNFLDFDLPKIRERHNYKKHYKKWDEEGS